MKNLRGFFTRVLPLLLVLSAGATAAAAGDCPGKTIVGNDNDNKIEGTCGPDKLYGLGGNDKLIGADGADKLFGGDGNDKLLGGRGADTLNGEADDDTLTGQGGGDTLKGGAGTDAASYAGSPEGVKVSLHAEGNAPAGGHAKGDELATIETLLGSSKADKLETANTFPDTTTVAGLKGSDKLIAHFLDVVDYTRSPDAIEITLGDSEAETGGHAQGDVLEQYGAAVLASRHDDVLSGDANSSTFHGMGGDDELLGYSGGDTLYGETSWNREVVGVPGSDDLSGGSDGDYLEGGPMGDSILDSEGSNTLIYTGSDSGVTVDLTNSGATASGGDAEGDTISGSFNWIYGSTHGDSLTGTPGDERFAPGAGDDIVNGDANNPLSIQTGAPSLGDQLFFLSSTSQENGVTVNLSTGAATGEGTDQITGIETVFGTEGPDSLTGAAGRQILVSSFGDDTAVDQFFGLAGSDYLGGADGDSFDGGTGDETATWENYANPGDVCDWGAGTPAAATNCENTPEDWQGPFIAGRSRAPGLAPRAGGLLP